MKRTITPTQVSQPAGGTQAPSNASTGAFGGFGGLGVANAHQPSAANSLGGFGAFGTLGAMGTPTAAKVKPGQVPPEAPYVAPAPKVWPQMAAPVQPTWNLPTLQTATPNLGAFNGWWNR